VTEVNLFDVDFQRDEHAVGGYECAAARVGPLLGAEKLGLSVYELRPGQSICPYHYELGQEEWLIVLVGSPTLRTPHGEHELRAWDCAFFPAGEDGAHKVSNRTNEVVRVCIWSNRVAVATSVYPDSGKIGVWPPGKLFRLDAAADYWDGEGQRNALTTK
jgi:uncharacterized cupin superfamily protein